ncbi:hypothetical protein GALMADRAFT_235500 [Galerina marginata CBS 339.88]|uniref:Anaphase-promoting complex subunit 4 WD40 domain-containing protein n=1 Tax=Galerina marginata (strain CBS 339.88) TaxID=685588 RepID=A0A067TU07_GALM3|nr:hypothetical protein GALMADRAFT_235500 [Galerina marginata CBS 339.88]
MLPSPSSSPRVVLAPRTNTLKTPQPITSGHYLPTPPSYNKYKRRHVTEDKKPQKRPKLDRGDSSESEESDVESDEDVFMDDVTVGHLRTQRTSPFQRHSRLLINPAVTSRRPFAFTLPILQSFVSSNKADIFKCQSIGDDTYLTPPYACSYSHNARAGGVPLLAVATEQGTVHILNTSKRNDWDPEPPRTTIQPHNNAVFDIKWNTDDSSLATCSGDQSTRISCPKTGQITHVLRGHTSTVKCMAWDPSNASLLATGGRDGAICLWDLRVGEQSRDSGDLAAVSPVTTIHGAHEDTTVKSKPKPRKGKQSPAPRTITNVLYPESQPFSLVSSSSFDGTLRSWDLRQPSTPKKKSSKIQVPPELQASFLDPTSLRGSRRPRGIISLANGTGPSAGLIFGIGADSRVHAYDLPTLAPRRNTFSHENLQANSFYVGLSVSPCGRWLACAGSGNLGNTFLFDVENACRSASVAQRGVELKGQLAEVGAIDWAENALATCSDDGTVRIWRPDLETHIKCREQPEESKWDWSWSA